MAPRSKTTVLILAAVVLSVVVALQLRGTWIGIGVTLEPSDTFTDQPSDELVIEPDATFVRVFHNGCNETYRYSVEETADEIWVLAEMRQQSSVNDCLAIFEERLELDQPIGRRQILDKATGEILLPASQG